MPVTTEMQNLQLQLASIEDRVQGFEARMDERFSSLRERMDDRNELTRMLITSTVREAVEAAIRVNVAPLADKVDKLEDSQMESKAVFRTATKGAALVGGGISIIWGALQALLSYTGHS